MNNFRGMRNPRTPLTGSIGLCERINCVRYSDERKKVKKKKSELLQITAQIALKKISWMHFGIAKLVLKVGMCKCSCDSVSVLKPNAVALVNHFIIKINFKLNPAQLKLNQKFAPIEMKRTKRPFHRTFASFPFRWFRL